MKSSIFKLDYVVYLQDEDNDNHNSIGGGGSGM